MNIIELPVERWQDYKEVRLACMKLFPQAYSSSYEENLLYTEEDWRKYLERAANGETILLFAEVDGKIVGSAGAFFYKAAKEKHKATIFGVGVLPEYHGQGIGRQLVEAVMVRLQAMPHIKKMDLAVTTSQQAAVKLYEKLGFVRVGEMKKELFVDGQFYDIYEMEKLIP